jgi:dolichol-phosphate mannosyltransferase
MGAKMNLTIIIPFYNERQNLSNLKTDLIPVITDLMQPDRHPDLEPIDQAEIVCVDDGSTDGSADWLRAEFETFAQPGITLHIEQHERNRGLGAALRTGFAAASGDVLITTDSDGTYRFATIPQLLACMKPGVDIVTASPYHPDGEVVGVPAWRLIFSRGSSLLYRLLVSRRVHTYTALFRAYRRHVIQTYTFEADGFLAGTELMVKAMLDGCQVAEFPATLHRRNFGVSKAKILRTIQAHLLFLARVALHRLGIRALASPGRSPEAQTSRV